MILAIVLTMGFVFRVAHASPAVSSPPLTPQPAPNVLISSFGLDAPSQLNFVEIYNQSAKPVNISGWYLSLSTQASITSSCTTTTYTPADNNSNGWLRSKSYYAFFAGTSTASSNNNFSTVSSISTGCKTPQGVGSVLRLFNGFGKTDQIISMPYEPSGGLIRKQSQRDNSVHSTRTLTDNYNDDYVAPSAGDSDNNGNYVVYTEKLYTPPADEAGLQITEILPHAKSCLPWNNDLTCNDYIKIRCPILCKDIDWLNQYNIAYKSTSSNSITSINLASSTLQGNSNFLLINEGENGFLSLTNSGGYAWIEDAAGVKQYPKTAVEYPSASSSSKIGEAYAKSGDSWQWTSTPTPNGSNVITQSKQKSDSAAASTQLKPCDPDQYRNPSTNRCKLKVSGARALMPCEPNQFRNPATNRCKNLLSKGSSLKPCQPDQYRNPATNRCKKKSSDTHKYKPCAPGSTRNAKTHRCRKASAIKGDRTGTIKDVDTPSKKSNSQWYVTIIVGAAAIAYAIYEWRSEIIENVKKLKHKIHS